jgi:hypothetical protein
LRLTKNPARCSRLVHWIVIRTSFSFLGFEFRFIPCMEKYLYAFTGSKVQGFKVAFSSLDWIWDAYLQEKRQRRQA